MTRKLTFAAILAAGLLGAGVVSAAGLPTIPHSIDGYSMTAEKNDCLMCHKKAAGAQPAKNEIPASHFDGQKLQTAYQQCTACHQVEKK